MPTESVVEQVATVHPTLTTALIEHKDEYGGRVIPYLFMGDATRWAVTRYLDEDLSAVADLLSLLERLFANGDEASRDLIALGFVENLPSSGQPAAGMRSVLSPLLAEEFRRVNW